jgi:D-psicose/D-tagatose/L-ribulose 3-epimerase
MRFGVNLLLFGDRVTPAVMRRFPHLKEMGFDGVEVPVQEPEKVATGRIRRAAEEAGLALTCSGSLPPGARFYGKDAAPRRAAGRYVREAIRTVADLGAPLICGPLYKAVGDCDESVPLTRQRSETARAMAPLAAEAAEAGVVLAIEPLNRFETNFLNTVEQGIAFCGHLKSRGAGLLLDTFHMHIEEKDTGAAIRAAAAAGVLSHFHASENDRGVAGTGQVDWTGASRALGGARYDGWVVLESFNQKNKAIKKAVSCWRPFFPSEEVFCRDGLAWVKARLVGRGSKR